MFDLRFRERLKVKVKEKTHTDKSATEERNNVADETFVKTVNENISPEFIELKELHGSYNEQGFRTRKSEGINHGGKPRSHQSKSKEPKWSRKLLKKTKLAPKGIGWKT